MAEWMITHEWDVHQGGDGPHLRGALNTYSIPMTFARGCGNDSRAAVAMLLDRGAHVNARATVDQAGIGRQAAIFRVATQSGDDGLALTRRLLERGADLTIRVKFPGSYERPREIAECTPLRYPLLFASDS